MSGSYMINDLAVYFAQNGHKVHIFTSDYKRKIYSDEFNKNITIYCLKAFKFRQSNKIIRFFQELIFPYLIIYHYRKELNKLNTKLAIYYSPPIFWKPVMKYLKKNNDTFNYLVLRDLFPKWLVDLNIIKDNSPIDLILKIFENNLYKISDAIGIQSPKNSIFFKDYYNHYLNKVELLYNWINPLNSHSNEAFVLDQKKINIVYVGNIGVAQNINFLKSLTKYISSKHHINLSFFSSGSLLNDLKNFVNFYNFKNIFFYKTIPNENLIYQISMADLGIVSLSSEFRTHNIPGKFLSYLNAGIPVACALNANNDLFEIVSKYRVGFCEHSDQVTSFMIKLDEFLKKNNQKDIKKNCAKLINELFSTKIAYLKILSHV